MTALKENLWVSIDLFGLFLFWLLLFSVWFFITREFTSCSTKVSISLYNNFNCNRHDLFGQPSKTYDEKFLGNQRDRESGFDFTGARLYSSKLGLFLGAEPLYDELHSISPYSYGLNNPAKFVDKDGNTPMLGALIGGAVGAIAGAVVNAGIQYYQTGTVDGNKVLAAAGGLVSGAIIGSTGGASLLMQGGVQATVSALSLESVATSFSAGVLGGAVEKTTLANLSGTDQQSNLAKKLTITGSLADGASGVVGSVAGAAIGEFAKQAVGGMIRADAQAIARDVAKNAMTTNSAKGIQNASGIVTNKAAASQAINSTTGQAKMTGAAAGASAAVGTPSGEVAKNKIDEKK